MYREHVTCVTCADWPYSLHKNLHIDVACNLARPLPFRDEVFDTVLLSDVLEHIPEPQQCVREIARILRPNGVLLMNTPFFYWLHETPHDYYRYTEFALCYLLEQAGIRIEVLEAIGGSPEVFADLAAKHLATAPLVGRTLANAITSGALALRRLRFWRSLSRKSARLLPLGYFVIGRRAV
jgi:SAM-dependent methyltransferase